MCSHTVWMKHLYGRYGDHVFRCSLAEKLCGQYSGFCVCVQYYCMICKQWKTICSIRGFPIISVIFINAKFQVVVHSESFSICKTMKWERETSFNYLCPFGIVKYSSETGRRMKGDRIPSIQRKRRYLLTYETFTILSFFFFNSISF